MNDADSGNKKQTTYSAVEGVQTITELGSNENLYAIYHDTIRDVVWDENAGAVGDPEVVTAANAAVDLIDNRLNLRKGWTIVAPATLPDGVYSFMVSDNATPVVGDTVLFGKICNIMGGKIQTMDNR